MIAEAFVRLLKPLARLAIRVQFSVPELIETVKLACVEVAIEDMQAQGQRANESRVSAVTGLRRPEVKRLMAGRLKEDESRMNVTARVITLWQSGPQYSKGGRPLPLTWKGPKSEFHTLVSSISTALHCSTYQFALERAGYIERRGEYLHLIRGSATVGTDLDSGLKLLAAEQGTLFQVVTENLFDAPQTSHLHFRTEFDNIDPADLEQVREWMNARGRELHRDARKYFATFDRDITSQSPGSSPGRAVVSLTTFGLGITKR